MAREVRGDLIGGIAKVELGLAADDLGRQEVRDTGVEHGETIGVVVRDEAVESGEIRCFLALGLLGLCHRDLIVIDGWVIFSIMCSYRVLAALKLKFRNYMDNMVEPAFESRMQQQSGQARL